MMAQYARSRRSTFILCHEASHLVAEEVSRRKKLGLPHASKTDVVNDWLIDSGKRRGLKGLKDDEEDTQ
jgi:hypothetical protein